MKVRWSRDSIRLRLTPSELASLLQGEAVIETVIFPGGTAWSIQLAASAVTELVSEGPTALLKLSSPDRQRLAAPDTEGIYFQTESGLRYFVEKDFPCAHPRTAEASEPAAFDAAAGLEQHKSTFPAISR